MLFIKCLLSVLIPFCAVQATNISNVLQNPLNGTFSSSRLQSGPIYLLDTRTILVTQFVYTNKQSKNLLDKHNKWFRALMRTGARFDLEFGDGQDAHINQQFYTGVNLLLKLPLYYNFTMKDLFAVVILNDKDAIKTMVPISQSDVLNLPEYTDEGFLKKLQTFFYPKCCPVNRYYRGSECVDVINDASFAITDEIAVHEIRNKKYNTEPMENVVRQAFYPPVECAMVPLDDTDNYILFMNSQLRLDGFNHRLACLEWSTKEDAVLNHVVYVCLDETDSREWTSRGNANVSVFAEVALILLFSVVVDKYYF